MAIRFLMLTLSVIVLTYCAAAAKADTVTPSDRVETRLRVRETASTDSAIVGFLDPGESAELSESVPRWYKIQLSDGTIGFVSKGWSNVIPASSAQPLRLGAWNIKKLGHENGKDFPLVAKIIKDNFDFLVIVEVMQRQHAHPGYESLIQELGSGWKGLVTSTPRPNTGSGNSEFYAMVFRTPLVSTCNGADDLVYVADNDGAPASAGPDIFSREPAFGCFRSAKFDFAVAAYHARWAEGDTSEISDEADELGKVFQAMGSAFPGEKDLLIIGDFNLTPDDLQLALGGAESHVVGSGSTLNTTGARTQNLYDHLLISSSQETGELVGSGSVLDVRAEASTERVFFQTVSDHLPIQARFKTGGPDDD